MTTNSAATIGPVPHMLQLSFTHCTNMATALMNRKVRMATMIVSMFIPPAYHGRLAVQRQYRFHKPE